MLARPFCVLSSSYTVFFLNVLIESELGMKFQCLIAKMLGKEARKKLVENNFIILLAVWKRLSNIQLLTFKQKVTM